MVTSNFWSIIKYPIHDNRETILLVNICNALALGMLQPWIPPPPSKDAVVPTGPEDPPVRGSAKKKGAAAAGNNKKPAATVTISPDAQPDLKKAIEVGCRRS